ncbi:MAG: molybdopterin-dependent oxidoreductase [Candidatus Latescibacteria bacterium]|nr:molybdopterin-dependent oxidoreductase [bacterium]MBD3422830.1 molybdopterin-dependent oxidoreductase [Candidatus Latescibacterota bacterium]
MREIKANCSFCSLACPLIFRGGKRGPVFTGEALLSVDWDKSEESEYEGSLCARGNAAASFVSSPDRLNYPFVLGERTDFEAAVKEAASELSSIREKEGSDSIGILLGGDLTEEEASMAVRFAREVLETDNIMMLAPDDTPLLRGWYQSELSSVKPSGPKPEGNRSATLIVGDTFADHPCTARSVLEDRYGGRGNELIVVSPNVTNTAWFATRHIQCNPGGEAAAAVGLLKAAAEKSGADLPGELGKLVNGAGWNEIERLCGVKSDILIEAAETMLGAARVNTYISNLFGRIGAPALAQAAAEALTGICPGDSQFTTQLVQQNTLGVYSALQGVDRKKMLARLVEGKIKGLIILGLDLMSEYPAPAIEKAIREDTFTLATQIFRSTTAERANVVIPAASLSEKKGTVRPGFDREIVRDEGSIINPPGGVYTDAEVLQALSAAMGRELAGEGSTSAAMRRSGQIEWVSGEWSEYSASMKTLDGADIVLIPLSDPVHVGNGSLSSHFSWSRRTSPEPVLVIPAGLARELGISEGEKAVARTEGGSSSFKVKISDRIREGTVGVYIHYPTARKLFPWKLNSERGELELMPVGVTVSAEEKKS